MVQALPGVAVCRIRDSQIYGWIYGEDSPCFAHDDLSFARILQRNSDEVEGKFSKEIIHMTGINLITRGGFGMGWFLDPRN